MRQNQNTKTMVRETFQQTAVTLRKLYPSVAEDPTVESWTRLADRRQGQEVGKNALGNAEQKVGAFLCCMSAVEKDAGKGVMDRLWSKEIDKKLGVCTESTVRDSLEAISSVIRECDDLPVWFRYYAWDNVTKLGKYDAKEGKFRRRSGSTTSEYPMIRHDVLHVLFEKAQEYLRSDSRDGFDFNERFTQSWREAANVLPIPEDAQAVEGAWETYDVHGIDLLRERALLTSSCVSEMRHARGEVDVLRSIRGFRLRDQQTSLLSGSISIFLTIVAETGTLMSIYGTDYVEEDGFVRGQCVHDALIPALIEEVRKMPNSEEMVRNLYKRQKMIELEKKLATGQPLNGADAIFAYGLDDSTRVGKYDAVESMGEPLKRLEQIRAQIDKDHARSLIVDDYGETAAEILMDRYGLDKKDLMDYPSLVFRTDIDHGVIVRSMKPDEARSYWRYLKSMGIDLVLGDWWRNGGTADG